MTGSDSKALNKDERLAVLAEEILDVARSRLLVNLRYMDVALSFHGRAVYDGTLASDGRTIYYEPAYVLKLYRGSAEDLTRAYLHMVLHCIFHHQFVSGAVDSKLWDLACDIAAESTACELSLVCARTSRDDRQLMIIRRIRRETGFITAEKIYAGLRKGIASDAEIEEWSELFCRDDHSFWYLESTENTTDEAGTEQMMRFDDPQLAAEWKDIAEQIEMDIEMFAKVRGKYASSMVQNLRAVTRQHYDYSDFLRKFAVTRENLRVSEDEFDYIYYTY